VQLWIFPGCLYLKISYFTKSYIRAWDLNPATLNPCTDFTDLISLTMSRASTCKSQQTDPTKRMLVLLARFALESSDHQITAIPIRVTSVGSVVSFSRPAHRTLVRYLRDVGGSVAWLRPAVESDLPQAALINRRAQNSFCLLWSVEAHRIF
jgi:hypothetical protein